MLECFIKKSEPEKRRVKAVGGGKTAPAKSYKPRKDIGTQRPKSTREQQPTQTRGSAALSPREAQRKAAIERRAAKSGAKTKTATELLAKKAKKTPAVLPAALPVELSSAPVATEPTLNGRSPWLPVELSAAPESPSASSESDCEPPTPAMPGTPDDPLEGLDVN